MRRITLLILLISSSLHAQRQTKLSRSEIGFMIGGMYYIGDLNQYGHFKGMEPGAGLIYRFNVHSRLALRTSLTYGSFSASDENSRYAVIQNRNLSFRSQLYEAAGGLEFNYWPYQIGHKRYKATAYMLVEFAGFWFDPETEYQGEWVKLQPLATEGQGTTLNSKRPYSRLSFSMPVGLGVRCSLGKKVSLNLEYGIRKTFTDYIDDVGSNYYVNSTQLAQAKGTVSGELSNRSLDGSRFGRRGNDTTKDWYAFAGFMLTVKMGNPRKCFFEIGE